MLRPRLGILATLHLTASPHSLPQISLSELLQGLLLRFAIPRALRPSPELHLLRQYWEGQAPAMSAKPSTLLVRSKPIPLHDALLPSHVGSDRDLALAMGYLRPWG